MHVCIIGAGAAGTSALETIRRINENVKITMVSKDKKLYSLCALPYYISGKTDILYDFKIQNVNLMLGRRVVTIDTDNYCVRFNDNGKLSYDKLLIATGSTPIVPRIPGIEKENVYYLNSIEDAMSIKRVVSTCKNVVIIGAGFTGLECCVAFRKLGLNVSVVEMEDQVLPRMLDKDMADVVADILLENGVEIYLNDRVTEISGAEKVENVKLEKCVVKADIVLVSVGVKPNIEIVKNTKIKTNRGIIVDKMMRTSAECVYAAGDVAEYVESGTSMINAVWLNAVYQGKVAGSNILGHDSKFIPIPIVNVITIFDVPVLSISLPLPLPLPLPSPSPSSELDILKLNKTKILLKNGNVVGIQSVGEVHGGLTNLIGHNSNQINKSVFIKKFYHPILNLTKK